MAETEGAAPGVALGGTEGLRVLRVGAGEVGLHQAGKSGPDSSAGDFLLLLSLLLLLLLLLSLLLLTGLLTVGGRRGIIVRVRVCNSLASTTKAFWVLSPKVKFI